MFKITELRKITIKGITIEYTLTIKKVKYINLRINRCGDILVSANKYTNKNIIDSFVASKMDFILQALSNVKSHSLKYLTGEQIYILGELYTIQVIKNLSVFALLENKKMIINVQDENSFSQKEEAVLELLKKLSLECFPPLVEQFFKQFKSLKKEMPKLEIKYFKSRWGSCTPSYNLIKLNSKLIKADTECINYVIIHEFCHFVHLNHSKNFYNLLASFCPNHKELREKLNSYYV